MNEILNWLTTQSISITILLFLVIITRALLITIKIPFRVIKILWFFPILFLVLPKYYVTPIGISPSYSADYLKSTHAGDIAVKGALPIIFEKIWICGVAMLLFCFLYQLLKYHFLLKCSCRLNEKVWINDFVQSPFVYGIISPKIIFPSRKCNQASFAYAVKHEQTHIVHFDNFFKIMAYLFSVCFWFLPLTWISYHLLSNDLELACDESTTKNFTPMQKKSYCESLIYYHCHCVSSLVYFSSNDIKKRIKHCLRYKKIDILQHCISVLCFIFLFVCCSTKHMVYASGSLAATNPIQRSKIISECLNSYNGILSNTYDVTLEDYGFKSYCGLNEDVDLAEPEVLVPFYELNTDSEGTQNKGKFIGYHYTGGLYYKVTDFASVDAVVQHLSQNVTDNLISSSDIKNYFFTYEDELYYHTQFNSNCNNVLDTDKYKIISDNTIQVSYSTKSNGLSDESLDISFDKQEGDWKIVAVFPAEGE